MIKQEINLLSYDRGMVENWNQKELIQQNVFNSVLWLSNYNPNLEHRTLVKRYGINNLEPTNNGYLEPKLYAPNAYANDKNSLLLHSRLLRTSNPKYNDTYVNFIKRIASNNIDIYKEWRPEYLNTLLTAVEQIEATAIIANSYIKYNQIFSNNYWFEPFYNHPQIPTMPYPGWYMLGTLQDSCRYGESLLITTSLLDDYEDAHIQLIKEYLYPCYVWKLWDMTKKRDNNNQYWNGIEFGVNDDLKNPGVSPNPYMLWRIQQPSRSMEGITGLANIDAFDELIPIVNGADDTNAVIKDISLVIWESNLFENPYFTKVFGDLNLKNFEKIQTFEVLENTEIQESINDAIALYTPIANELTNPNNDYIYSIRNIITTLDSAGFTDYTIQDINIKDSTKSVKCAVYGVFSGYTVESNIYLYAHILVLPTLLPDYINTKVPRMWLNCDKIPVVITMIINGIEVIVLRDTYKLKYGAEINMPNVIYDDFDSGGIWGKTNQNARSLNLKIENTIFYATAIPPNGKHKEEPWIIAPTIPALIESIYNPTLTTHILFEGPVNIGTPDPLTGIGTSDYLYPIINFSLRITETGFQKLFDNNVSAIRVYVSEPDEQGYLRSVGMSKYVDAPASTFKFPRVKDIKDEKQNSNFRLIKEFKIDGNGTKLNDHTEVELNNIPAKEVNSNAWLKTIDTWSTTEEVYWTVPQESQANNNGNQYPVPRVLSPNSDYFNPRHMLNININGFWTPDFIIWDYPLAKSPLNLQASGKYWDGIGAKCISVIKGRTFIAGTIDQDNQEEQSVIRYSAVQSGVASPDIFNDEDKIQVGHLPITALIEFREQLVIFSKENSYRLVMPNIYDTSTWEFLEAVENSGTLSKKTIINTPFGFVFGNETGIWISEGNIPESLTDKPEYMIAISSLWKSLMFGSDYMYLSLINPGSVFIDTDINYNPYLELNYNIEHGELIISTPIDRTNTTYTTATHELRLIFSFSKRNWRIELYELTITDQNVICYSKYHRTHFINSSIYSAVHHLAYIESSPGNFTWESNIYYEKPDKSALQDTYYSSVGSSTTNKDIEGEIISHEVGNGIDDVLLHSAIIECVPNDTALVTAYTNDPSFSFETRNKQWRDQVYHMYKKYMINHNHSGFANPGYLANDTWYDLIMHNVLAKKAFNPFNSLMQTPLSTGDEIFKDDSTPQVERANAGRESIVLLSPLNVKSRLMRFKWISKNVPKIKSILIKIIIHKRRSE